MSPTMIAGGVAAVLVALLGLQTWRLGSAQETIGELTAKVEHQVAQTQQAVSVNQSLNTNIDELATKITDMVEARRLEREEHDRVLAARDEDIAAATAAARRLEGERDEIFRNDLGCNEMGSISISATCPLIADQLRERTNRRGGNGGQDGGGASGSGAPNTTPVNETSVLSAAAG